MLSKYQSSWKIAMIRTQVQLTEEQARALRDLASVRQVSVAELIRQSVNTLIQSSGEIDMEERRRRAIAAAGRFRSERRTSLRSMMSIWRTLSKDKRTIQRLRVDDAIT
jgi:hypothetical protein